ncbi:DUF4922 domain-containing protein [Neptuniibacter sp. UBA847]|nr:DUF4922 domain-containing protein [Neptuniibacter sp. UBA847]
MLSELWDKAAKVTQAAYESKALLSYQASVETVTEAGLTFYIRTLENLGEKQSPTFTKTDQNSLEASVKRNPFLEHDSELFVTNIGPNHKCLLNKYNVLDQHLLLVTQQFELQISVLHQQDFNALHECLSAAPALAFYNGGKTAGASQQHKHIQLIKAPDSINQLVGLNPQLEMLNDEVPRELETLPFKHAALALPAGLFDPNKSEDEAKDAAIQLKHLYDRLRMTLGLDCFTDSEHSEQLPAYNLLLTQKWMLVVPRSSESYAGISLNALAFSGSILVKNKDQAEEVKKAGISKILQSVSL